MKRPSPCRCQNSVLDPDSGNCVMCGKVPASRMAPMPDTRQDWEHPVSHFERECRRIAEEAAG